MESVVAEVGVVDRVHERLLLVAEVGLRRFAQNRIAHDLVLLGIGAFVRAVEDGVVVVERVDVVLVHFAAEARIGRVGSGESERRSQRGQIAHERVDDLVLGGVTVSRERGQLAYLVVEVLERLEVVLVGLVGLANAERVVAVDGASDVGLARKGARQVDEAELVADGRAVARDLDADRLVAVAAFAARALTHRLQVSGESNSHYDLEVEHHAVLVQLDNHDLEEDVDLLTKRDQLTAVEDVVDLERVAQLSVRLVRHVEAILVVEMLVDLVGGHLSLDHDRIVVHLLVVLAHRHFGYHQVGLFQVGADRVEVQLHFAPIPQFVALLELEKIATTHLVIENASIALLFVLFNNRLGLLHFALRSGQLQLKFLYRFVLLFQFIAQHFDQYEKILCVHLVQVERPLCRSISISVSLQNSSANCTRSKKESNNEKASNMNTEKTSFFLVWNMLFYKIKMCFILLKTRFTNKSNTASASVHRWTETH